ncbi:MAG TPA: hypothetical protein EYQ08_11020 [Planctomycetes bacterium]|nr:hypothetical protein [Planctomycetota bacterium]
MITVTTPSVRSIACGILFWVLLGSASPVVAADLRIELVEEGWGNATLVDVHAVLLSAAEPLWQAAGSPQLPLIRVEPSGGPIVLHRRGPDGAIRVRLAVQGRRWAQMAYQFGHEMGHILCGFDEDPDPHHWLEEAVCEAASIFTLRQMAKRWKDHPPHPNWSSYAAHLQQYADDLIEKGTLEKGIRFKKWRLEHQSQLQQNPQDRDLLRVVAVQWLPLLEKYPATWRALRFLNHGVPEPEEKLSKALQRWELSCPEGDRIQVSRVRKMLGVQ